MSNMYIKTKTKMATNAYLKVKPTRSSIACAVLPMSHLLYCFRPPDGGRLSSTPACHGFGLDRASMKFVLEVLPNAAVDNNSARIGAKDEFYLLALK
jgi:hypothetical protein